jgi:hypothetical protein
LVIRPLKGRFNGFQVKTLDDLDFGRPVAFEVGQMVFGETMF